MSIPLSRRQKVIERAGRCCEYCRIGQPDVTAPFEIDHVIPLKHHGTDEFDNLCFACYQCNGYKGPNIAAADPQTGKPTFLFNPRKQLWHDHFDINPDGSLIGKTPEGRVTIDVLRINEEARIQYRELATRIGEYPCISPSE